MKTIPTAAVRETITSGILLCDFHEFHVAAEALMGRPIFTHEFGSKDLWREMKEKAAEEWPPLTEEERTEIEHAKKNIR